MTEAQTEAAARKLCELRGKNPDELVAHGVDSDGSGATFDVLLYSPAWQRAAREIVAADRMRQALAAGDAVPDTPTAPG